MDRAERFLAGRGAWAVPVGRALPSVRTFMSLIRGIIEVPVARFAQRIRELRREVREGRHTRMRDPVG